MIRRPPTSLSVQESDVETLKAYRRAKMMQHNPNLTSSSFSSIRPDESGSVHDSHHSHHHHMHHHHHHHHPHYHARDGSDEQEDPGRKPGLSQQRTTTRISHKTESITLDTLTTAYKHHSPKLEASQKGGESVGSDDARR